MIEWNDQNSQWSNRRTSFTRSLEAKKRQTWHPQLVEPFSSESFNFSYFCIPSYICKRWLRYMPVVNLHNWKYVALFFFLVKWTEAATRQTKDNQCHLRSKPFPSVNAISVHLKESARQNQIYFHRRSSLAIRNSLRFRRFSFLTSLRVKFSDVHTQLGSRRFSWYFCNTSLFSHNIFIYLFFFLINTFSFDIIFLRDSLYSFQISFAHLAFPEQFYNVSTLFRYPEM